MRRPTHIYRADIDGLRAIAVLSVLFFHATPELLPGGFVGVDIFFVISGYLITSILAAEVQHGQFSILQFYIRRARRLFPSLIAVLSATFIAGWFLLLPDEWSALGKHIVSGSAFISNLTLWGEVGYFDSSSDQKPLLHLWSLAVEEQFYLFWPIAIYATSRKSLRPLLLLTATIGTVSFVACIIVTYLDASSAFYVPITRFWELLAGAALSIWRESKGPTQATSAKLEIAGLAGIGCLLISVFTFTPNVQFPGYAAGVPVLGTVLLIACGPNALLNKFLLSHRWLVGIGLISYPLYLWHWPILVFNRLLTPPSPVGWQRLTALILLGVFLAWVSYRFIESPIRKQWLNLSAQGIACILWGMLLTVGALGASAWAGFFAPYSHKFPVALNINQAGSDWEYNSDRTWAGGKGGIVLFVGDSHMEQYAPRIDEIMRTHASQTYTAKLLTRSGCAPIPGIDRLSIDCADFTRRAFIAMKDREVTTIVLAGSWVGLAQRKDYFKVDDLTRRPIDPLTDSSAWLLQDWRKELQKLVLAGKRVVVVLGSPRGPQVDPKLLTQRGAWEFDRGSRLRNRHELEKIVHDTNMRIANSALSAGAEVLDPFQDFCKLNQCGVASFDGVPYFKDESHLRASFVRHNVHFLDKYLPEH